MSRPSTRSYPAGAGIAAIETLIVPRAGDLGAPRCAGPAGA
jgi:hypothetical protein